MACVEVSSKKKNQSNKRFETQCGGSRGRALCFGLLLNDKFSKCPENWNTGCLCVCLELENPSFCVYVCTSTRWTLNPSRTCAVACRTLHLDHAAQSCFALLIYERTYAHASRLLFTATAIILTNDAFWLFKLSFDGLYSSDFDVWR